MKIKTVLLSLLTASGIYSAHAAESVDAYYTITELVTKVSTSSQEGPFGPYATAVSGDGSQLALMTNAFNLMHTWDMNFPYTNDYGCVYASDICHYQRYGSSKYPFGWAQWRENLRLAIGNGYQANGLSYILAEGETGNVPGLTPDLVFAGPSETIGSDSIINAFTQDGMQLVGSASAPFISSDGQYKREFSRRAFARTTGSALSCSLLPDVFGDDLSADRGGFSAAYGINKQVSSTGFNSGAVSTIVVGSAGVGLPENSWSSFDDCQSGENYEFYRCPGFNTQAWAWDLAGCVNGDENLQGQPIAQNWVNRDGSNPTYSSSAMAINNNGIAVGMSTYALSDSISNGRARAAYFEPDTAGVYQMTPIPNLDASFSDFNDIVRHTWAVDINDNNLVIGNLRYDEEKARNRPVEFFVYDKNTQAVTWPLLNKPQSGSNSEIHAINNNNLAIGWQDAIGQDNPTINGTSRRQDGFVYDYNLNQTRRLTNLTCSIKEGKSDHPLYKIVYPRAITENNEIIATAYKYPSATDYLNNTNPTSILVKLKPNEDMAMANAPLCTTLFEELELPKFERQGAALWSFFPFLLLALLRKRGRYLSNN